MAISTRAKVIAPFPALLDAKEAANTNRSRYEVELIVKYTHVVLTSMEATPGLSRQQLESLIDEDFPHLSTYRGTPVDLEWSLESVEERGPYRLKLQDPPE